MTPSGKKVYLFIAVVAVLTAIVATTIYVTVSTSSDNECNGSSTTTVYPKYNANLRSPYLPSFVGLSMPTGCTVKIYLQFNSEFGFPGPANSSTYTLELSNTTWPGATYVGVWYLNRQGGTTMGVHRVQNDTLNATIYPSTVTTSNHNGSDFYFDSSFTVTITASNLTKGFYVLALPYRTFVPLAVGYNVSQANMTKDYPGFGEEIPPSLIFPGVVVSIMRMSDAMSIGYVH